MPLTGDLIARSSTWRCRFLHQQILSLAHQIAGAQLERETFVEQVGIGHSVPVGELGIFQIVLGLFVIDDGYDTKPECLIRAAFLAVRSGQRNHRQIGRLALVERELPRLDALSFEFYLALLERRFRLLQPTREVRAVDGRYDLTFDDLLTCVDMQRDRAGCGRIQGRTDRGHHPALHRHIPHQVAARYGGDAHPVLWNTDRGICPALQERRGQPGERDDGEDRAACEQLHFAPCWRLQANVLRRCIRDFQFRPPAASPIGPRWRAV